MKRRFQLVAALLACAAFGFSGCYALLEKPIMNARDFQPFANKEYGSPCKFLQVEDVNLAYVEAGEGPTVLLIHGGMIPMNQFSSLSRTPLFDAPTIFGIGGAFIVAGLPMQVFYSVNPLRAQTYAHSGALATIDTWKYNFDELAKHFHVIAVDLPGFGNSEKPDIAYKTEDFTRYLNAFLDAKGIAKTSVVGLGVGGMIALDLVLTHPERVEKLVLINSEGTHHPRYYLGMTNKAAVMALSIQQKEKAAKINVWIPLYKHLFAKRAIRHVLHEKNPGNLGNYMVADEGKAKEFMDQLIAYKTEYMKSEEFTKEVRALHKTLVNLKRGELRAKITQGTETIEAPTLIVWGLKNPRPPIKKAKKKSDSEAYFLDKAIPNSTLSVYAQSGYFPMVEEADTFNRQLIQFLTGEVVPAAAAAPAPEEK